FTFVLAKLRADNTAVPLGGSVTLTCSVNHSSSSGWKYDWYIENSGVLVSPEDAVFLSNGQIRVSQGGHYWCIGERVNPVYSSEYTSNRPVVTLYPNWSEIYRGETITVRCEIHGGDTEWDYEWETNSVIKPPNQNEYRIRSASSSNSGNYRCKGRMKSSQYNTTEWSDSVTLTVSIPSKPTVTLQPSWTQIYSGETVTVRCEIQGGEGAQWTYEWRAAKLNTPPTSNEYRITVTESDSGGYSCRGRRDYFFTEWSDIITLTVSFSNRPVVTLYPNWSEIYRGETITVRCEIHGGDTEWDYEWETNSMIKAPNQSEYRIRSASSSNSGNYRCKGRMKSSQHKTTEWSDSVTLTVSDNVHSAASLTVSPDRVQHFTSDSVSLTCEGNFTEWRVRKFSEDGRLYSDCRRMTGSTCNINTSESDTAVYWCESGSGEFSSAVNITVQNDGNGPILVSPVHPVTEGASVRLSCSLRTQKILSNVFFYHNDKLIQNDPRGELKISAVSKSDEGFYKCQYSGRESAQSWMSVKVNKIIISGSAEGDYANVTSVIQLKVINKTSECTKCEI
uniref:Ig-like domain-containing protein n=1 Tax=Oreochromis niloticus TaxID=8128 RepID=I3K5E0_ORENI